MIQSGRTGDVIWKTNPTKEVDSISRPRREDLVSKTCVDFDADLGYPLDLIAHHTITFYITIA
jgi:hypothetical protein